MNLLLSLPPEIEAKLLEQSVRTGKVPEELAIRALEEQFRVAEEAPATLSAEEWVDDIRAWAKGHRHLPHEVDDSRDRIYAGRGE